MNPQMALKILDHPDLSLRWEAVQEMPKLTVWNARRWLPVFEKACNDRQPRIRYQAIAQFINKRSPNKAQFFLAKKMLHDWHPRVRRAAIVALSYMLFHFRKAKSSLQRMLDDPNAAVRHEALKALSKRQTEDRILGIGPFLNGAELIKEYRFDTPAQSRSTDPARRVLDL